MKPFKMKRSMIANSKGILRDVGNRFLIGCTVLGNRQDLRDRQAMRPDLASFYLKKLQVFEKT